MEGDGEGGGGMGAGGGEGRRRGEGGRGAGEKEMSCSGTWSDALDTHVLHCCFNITSGKHSHTQPAGKSAIAPSSKVGRGTDVESLGFRAPV